MNAMRAPPWPRRGVLVAQLHALLLQFRQRRIDVVAFEADVEQAGALRLDPLRDTGILVLAFQQLHIGLAHRQHRQPRPRPLLLYSISRPNVSRSIATDCLIESTAMAMCSMRLIFMSAPFRRSCCRCPPDTPARRCATRGQWLSSRVMSSMPFTVSGNIRPPIRSLHHADRPHMPPTSLRRRIEPGRPAVMRGQPLHPVAPASSFQCSTEPPGMADLVRAHRRIADKDQLVVRPVGPQHLPGRDRPPRTGGDYASTAAHTGSCGSSSTPGA